VEKFQAGFGNRTSIYQQPPSPEVDDAWNDLYNDFGISRIPKAQAALLPNRTYPYARDEGYYIASISVFHHLHCLNMIRKALYPEYYRKLFDEAQLAGFLGREHIGHCVDALRQSLMCSSDVSVIVWQWEKETQRVHPQAEVVHTCRNFDKIRDWGLKNRAVMDFDFDVLVEDDIVVPEI